MLLHTCNCKASEGVGGSNSDAPLAPTLPYQKKPGWLRRSSVSHARSRATEGSLSSSGWASSISTEQTGQARRGTLRSRRSSHSSMQLVWKRWPHGVRRRVCCPCSKEVRKYVRKSVSK